MDEKFFPAKIEKKWQTRWAEKRTFQATKDDNREKFYCLEMLPYPSGRLHMGHVRNYSIGDAISWYKRLQGFNVIHPIGWDSFGQPAEQAAIKKGVNPRDWTEDNISQMRAQLQALGVGYDWEREIAAHRPEYYKFDQWFFLKMLEKGLAYRKDSDVNWCPRCETTLSNEQASGGICWRCGSPVEKQSRPQWFLKITDYAGELLDDMKLIEDGWPERVLTMQRNWIGRSKGCFLKFTVTDNAEQSIEVFTTRVDTVYGVNAIVVAPDHPFVVERSESLASETVASIEEMKIEQAKPVDYGVEVEKAGVDTGLTAINPFSGETVPIWVGNYVLMSYGTGAVMSVPAHDERDFEFAEKYELPITAVIKAKGTEGSTERPTKAFSEKGELFNSGDWDGLKSKDAISKMSYHAEQSQFGNAATTYRLRDWGISRQRFWGAPIPIVYCEDCGAVPVAESELPVELPESAPFTGVGESPLSMVEDFVNTTCPKCNEPARRETDTMDTFVDSTWYYYRYLDPKNQELPFDKAEADYWMPLDLYIGGIDHAVMHLLYTRFWTKAMRDLGLVDIDEPAKNLLTQGMVVGESFYNKKTESYVFEEEVDIERDANGKLLSAKMKDGSGDVRVAVEKMGKSKLNGVDPDDMIEAYGSDAVRLFILFAAPVENELVWQESGIEGAVRFLQRVWRYVHKWQDSFVGDDNEPAELSEQAVVLRQKTHQTIARITENFETGQFNTPVAALMELSNAIYEIKEEPSAADEATVFAVSEAVRSLVLMLAPYAPHTAEELWTVINGGEEGILESNARFPVADDAVAKEDNIEIAVQVNGKLRARVNAPADSPNELLEKLALAEPKVIEFTKGKEVVKVIVVPNRLVNVVAKG